MSKKRRRRDKEQDEFNTWIKEQHDYKVTTSCPWCGKPLKEEALPFGKLTLCENIICKYRVVKKNL